MHQAHALIAQSKDQQTRIAAAVSAMLLELGRLLKAGKITEEQFAAALVAAERLGHDRSAEAMVDFIRRFRALQDPDGLHVDPVLAEFDSGASYGRAVGVLGDLGTLERTQEDYDAEFERIISNMASRAFRHALNSGRDTMVLSAAANGTRWRRVAGAGACPFCVMLATRSDYRTKESASRVVGRARGYGNAHYRATGEVSYGGVIERGKNKGKDRRRGKRPIGESYHDHCSCTVVEVVGDLPLTEVEQSQHDAYRNAVEACEKEGIPANTANILRKMAESRSGQRSKGQRKPELSTGSQGGGKPPRRVQGMRGDDMPDEFPAFNGWKPPVRRSEIEEFTLLDAEILLDGDGSGHGHHRHGSNIEGKTEFPAGWGEAEVLDWIRDIIDHPSNGEPLDYGVGVRLTGFSNGVLGVVIVRKYEGWAAIATAHPLKENGFHV